MKTQPLVAIPDPIDQAGIDALTGQFGVLACSGMNLPIRQAKIRDADAVIVRNFKLDGGLLRSCPRLKVIAKHGAGVDNIDFAAASEMGIVVANVPGGNAAGVAEGTVALMLAVLRQTPKVHDLVVAGDWSARFSLEFHQLTDRTLGLVGLGHIGSLVARICSRGFGMRVLAYDPALDEGTFGERGAEKVETLADLLRMSDVVSLHAPLTSETHHLIGANELRMMKREAVLVNAARGALVDTVALCEALENCWIAGAGLDVLEAEPPSPGDPLLRARNLVLTPHVAGSTKDANRHLALATARIVTDVLQGVPPMGLLNPEIWNSRRQ